MGNSLLDGSRVHLPVHSPSLAIDAAALDAFIQGAIAALQAIGEEAQSFATGYNQVVRWARFNRPTLAFERQNQLQAWQMSFEKARRRTRKTLLHSAQKRDKPVCCFESPRYREV